MSLNLLRHFRVTEWLRLEVTSVGQLVQLQMLRQGQLQLEAQGPVQTAFVSLQGWRLHHLLCATCGVLHHSKKVFSDVQAKPCFSLYHCFLSHHCVPLKSLTSVFCHFHTLMMFCLNFLSFGLGSPSSLSLSSQERHSSPSIISGHLAGLCPAAPHVPCTGEPQTEPCTTRGGAAAPSAAPLTRGTWWLEQFTPYSGLCC